MHDMDLSDVWTPKLVGERLVEAVRWARYNAGATAPASVRALMPTFIPTANDFEAEGWGHRERAEDDDAPPPEAPRRLSPAKVSAILDALFWCARYTVDGHPGSTRVLNRWIVAKVYRMNFDKLVDREFSMSRQHAYRLRDRALAAIAMGLTRDGVAP
ncbi:hypothetical protein [Devosia ginsengisoli]|uniref:hypothetical protein n=1 Tax=Devosia ginsengisoli TaxID=400770 RepID=UPI0026ECDE1B|nr:hypothetical protein [Devosia ginsengisoli]MCR6673277.1 hypothetical protein [Devosia ginsengisoli]